MDEGQGTHSGEGGIEATFEIHLQYLIIVGQGPIGSITFETFTEILMTFFFEVRF